MEEYIFSNGLKLVYKKVTSELTSICIGLNAGACLDEEKLGLAHATEHMVYKSTINRSEAEINEALSKTFGFYNAMTNYPYVIYYGTLLSTDFESGIELYSDIIMNPIFPKEGFKEEMDVIIEELNEWDEELDQYCEDKLFVNSFKRKRIKYPIIGTKSDLIKITLDDIKEFYEKNYFPENTKISIVTSLEIDEVVNIVSKYIGSWEKQGIVRDDEIIELPCFDTYIDIKEGIVNSKIQIIAPINTLNESELNAFRIFNSFFGDGVNSILFDNLRTKNGMVYDILTRVAFEKNISIYKIVYSVSSENADKSIKLIRDIINNLDYYKSLLTKEKLRELVKSIKLRKLFMEEQSIQLAKQLCTFEVMFGNYKLYEEITDNMEEFSAEFIIETAKKVLSNLSIQIISSR